ncbi:hypothetical protein A3D88_01925 [Candidatus Peribacteria bacterium RIFCSPHIGHO2_02_FULL_52_16]|nr:MAG: hypothetical protein A2706_05120 [Candidatus Peribacteria bacterium RIFCSPHIGHO2_01_FULL_51_35]OGJ61144.1 MAG: hypothetical protein A3D88_01925 [Candidatus Peribacteria bacterium RIFCSPHIGHO2_02_FULL_52_16]
MPFDSAEKSASSNNPWFVVSVGLICLMVGYGAASLNVFGGGLLAGNPTVANNPPNAPNVPPPPAPPAEEAGDVPEVTAEDHIRGNPNAAVTIVEYSDYECPFCIRHHPTMKQVTEKYGDDVNWVYRHFPLSFHPKAEPAALASECVAELGGNDAFWKFTDTVFEEGNYDYAAIAKDLGLNASQFDSCLSGAKYRDKVNAQMSGGSAAGVDGTPGSIVINNKTGDTRLISGAVPASSFESVIDAMLQ